MTTTDWVPPPPSSRLRAGRAARPLTARVHGGIGAREMTADEELRAQDWPRITAQLTAIAFKRTRRCGWETAQELAQTAITRAFVHGTGWDPRKGPLMGYLVAQVIGLARNEARRRRNACEVELDNEVEALVPNDDEPIDDVLDRRRYAARFRERLLATVAGDREATVVIGFMEKGTAKPGDLVLASGLTLPQVEDARRRIRYQAERITAEMSLEIEEEDRRMQPARGKVKGG
jgi:hypothetical protein